MTDPEIYDDDLDRMVHAGVATRHLAEVLGQFVEQLVENGIGRKMAERMAESLMVGMIHE